MWTFGINVSGNANDNAEDDAEDDKEEAKECAARRRFPGVLVFLLNLCSKTFTRRIKAQDDEEDELSEDQHR